jgi:hypothetical protein
VLASSSTARRVKRQTPSIGVAAAHLILAPPLLDIKLPLIQSAKVRCSRNAAETVRKAPRER